MQRLEIEAVHDGKLRWILSTAILATCVAVLVGCKPSARDLGDRRITAGDSGGPTDRDLLKARAAFQTKHISNSYKTDGPADPPQPGTYQLVHYPSPAGQLAAYLTPNPGDGKKHPVLIWAHGGFGGLGTGGAAEPARAAGFVVFCPSWRGENDNPGQFELFYGEVEDAVAAVNYVSQLPYVDPARIYMAGHSTGGTMTLLTVESTPKLRAAFSFGGCPDVGNLMTLSGGKGYDNTPFDYRISDETRLRSAIHFVGAIHTPTFFFEGSQSALYCRDAKNMEQMAQRANVPFSAFVLPGGDHFNIVPPISRLIVRKMQADIGPTCNITLTQAEVQQSFQAQPRPRRGR
ncbi:MAG TPA: prolyl oligopeptidase family serine peptidase [Gemmataceae bacterium]|nr:prolyl oligopeptidase family serine peptidase [Gemmataceae bacterium]